MVEESKQRLAKGFAGGDPMPARFASVMATACTNRIRPLRISRVARLKRLSR